MGARRKSESQLNQREELVLAAIQHGDLYVKQILQALNAEGSPVPTEEGTIYPLLQKMQKRELVDSYLSTTKASGSGNQCRYYRPTPAGTRALQGVVDYRNNLPAVVSALRGNHNDG